MTQTTAAGTNGQPNYALDNRNAQGANHLGGLAGLMDGYSRARISRVSSLLGKTCMGIGSGAGTIESWLADQVGPTGQVWAVDLHTDRIAPHERLSIAALNLATDPLPGDSVDLIHTRLCLGHLPARKEIVARLVEHLNPGGVLVVEEFASTVGVGGVFRAPSQELDNLYTRFMAKRAEIFFASGTDRTWGGRQAHEHLIRCGLVGVETEVHASVWRGGSPGSRHAMGTLVQFAPKLLASGEFTEAEIGRLTALLDDPEFEVLGNPLASTVGYKQYSTRPGAG
jgi:SAM-dependent methyltransferase